MANDNNRSNQLNPVDRAYLDSRGCDLTQKDVSKIQSAEVKSAGKQSSSGLGAEAQQRLETIKSGDCSTKNN